MDFVKHGIGNGGSIRHLLISSKDLKGPSLNNPSIYLDRVTPPIKSAKESTDEFMRQQEELQN